MGERFRVDYLGDMQWGVIDTADGRLVGIDGGEPEDQLLCRDWKWVPEELNKLAATVAAQAERIRELERELVEARQRDEDATDVILRQGRELLEARPKAEAAERWCRLHRALDTLIDAETTMDDSAIDDAWMEYQGARDSLLAACPEKGGAG